MNFCGVPDWSDLPLTTKYLLWVCISISLFVAVVGCSACSIQGELEGKRCPCAPGYQCDETRGLCVITFDAGSGDADVLRDGDHDGDVDSDSDSDGDEDTQPSVMAMIPEGSFMMGCNPISDLACDYDELPYHEVNLSAYEIDRAELSQAEYSRCVDEGGCTVPEDNWNPATRGEEPVVDVTWDQADDYCRWAGKRLPTEAEWEKAARGDDGKVFPWGNVLPDCTLANYVSCGNRVDLVESHVEVESPYGTINQSGNVWEWVSDYYSATYYESSVVTNPSGPPSGDSWVIRGGSFDWPASALRTSKRLGWDHPTVVIGIRCARDAP